MTTQSFSDVTAQRWTDIKSAIQAKTGIVIPSDKSSEPLVYRGVKIEWALVGITLSITIDSVTLMDKLAGETEPVVMGQIAGAIATVQ